VTDASNRIAVVQNGEVVQNAGRGRVISNLPCPYVGPLR
jgi:hypothetical protein